jgi:hypothetical protein
MPTHIELVTALAKPPHAIMLTINMFGIDLWHGATGVAGECGELLEGVSGHSGTANLLEEMGDIEFYMQQIRSRSGIVRDPNIAGMARDMFAEGPTMLSLAVSAAIYGSQVLDTVKKMVIYNKPLDTFLLADQMFRLDIVLAVIRLHHGWTLEQVLQANIDKLSVRYASMGYTDAAAQARVDKDPQRKPFPGEPREPINADMAEMVERTRTA